ncbi:MAG: chromate transporter, partial [Alphaproteobacteria bacterium]
WDRLAANPWRAAVARGLGPMTIGLILAGAVSIERAVMQGHGPLPYALAAVVIAILGTVRINPFFLIAGGGLATWLARQAGIL